MQDNSNCFEAGDRSCSLDVTDDDVGKVDRLQAIKGRYYTESAVDNLELLSILNAGHFHLLVDWIPPLSEPFHFKERS